MQFHDRIAAIEARAKTLNVTVSGLCREAGVHYSSIHRWQRGEMSPNVASLDTTLGPLELLLDKKERSLLRKLTHRRKARPRATA